MRKIKNFLCLLSAVAITAAVSVPVYADTVVSGDADGNGIVNLYDVIRIAEYMLKPEETTISEGADYDGNGKIDLYDAIGTAGLLLKAAAS